MIYVAEIKSTTDKNEMKQLRLGLGQVLWFRQALSRSGRPVSAVLVAEREPATSDWLELCDSVDVLLLWPDRFQGQL